jgi:hypothetical protein
VRLSNRTRKAQTHAANALPHGRLLPQRNASFLRIFASDGEHATLAVKIAKAQPGVPVAVVATGTPFGSTGRWMRKDAE